MAKAKKKRASNMIPKLAINASFDEVIKVSATPYKPETKKVDKPKEEMKKNFSRNYGCSIKSSEIFLTVRHYFPNLTRISLLYKGNYIRVWTG